MSSPKNNETAISELIFALGLLIRRIRSEAPSETHELSWTQKAVIVRLEKDGPATIAELARAENVKPQSMGSAIAHLEEMGIVLKKMHPSDGRQMNVEISPKGVSMRKSLKDAKQIWLSEAVSKLSKSEQATLFAGGEIIKQLAEL